MIKLIGEQIHNTNRAKLAIWLMFAVIIVTISDLNSFIFKDISSSELVFPIFVFLKTIINILHIASLIALFYGFVERVTILTLLATISIILMDWQ